MKRLLVLLSAILGCISLSTRSSALPRFALRSGDPGCGCHVNPTGGSMRNEGGDNFAMNRLPVWKTGTKFSATISEGLRIGADFRSQFLVFNQKSVFDLVDPVAGMIHHDTSTGISGAQEMALPFYLSASLSESVVGYARYDPVTPGAWEGYLLAHLVHSSGEILEAGSVVNDAYVKVGAFLPTFGIRFDDHTIYTRGGSAGLSRFAGSGLFWQPNYKDEGFELGATLLDHLQLVGAFLNGNERAPSASFKVDPLGSFAFAFRGAYSTALIENMLSVEVGGSAYLHQVDHLPSANDRSDSTASTRLVAVHGGLRIGPATILAEADFGRFMFQPRQNRYHDNAKALAFEGAVDISQGLTGIVRFDNYRETDGPNDSLGVDVKSRIMVGVQWFPIRFLELRPEFRFAKLSVPSDEFEGVRVDQTETTLLMQTHIFF